eukprot:UC4_evm1s779
MSGGPVEAVKVTFSKLLWLALFSVCAWYAYDIRLFAIRTYGTVIHEFDPWFNMRATQYLADNGWKKFFQWYDYMVWYPLGRPVGTTICMFGLFLFPVVRSSIFQDYTFHVRPNPSRMQIASVTIWKVLNNFVGHEISLNDVCCYVPAWFGVSATFFLGLLASETSSSWSSGLFAAAIMAVIPAHLSRSVGGGYDNESVAMTAMCMCYFFWTRALRSDSSSGSDPRGATKDSITYGIALGFAYIYMAAAWGGFIFVINLIALHAFLLCAMGRFTGKLHRAYSLFYVIGTLGAMQVPIIGWGPIKSLEQLSGLAVFIGLQILEYVRVKKGKQSWREILKELIKTSIIVGLVVGLFATYKYQQGYFGPLGARIRGLFVKHTRTGNPLVDSVAEHQPASEQAYKQYLLQIYDVAPIGFSLMFLPGFWSDSNSFLIVYASVAYYFCTKMARLIILLGPVASATGGVAFGFAFDQLLLYPVGCIFSAIFSAKPKSAVKNEETVKKEDDVKEETVKPEVDSKKKDNGTEDDSEKNEKGPINNISKKAKAGWGFLMRVYNHWFVSLLRIALAVYLAREGIKPAQDFYNTCRSMAEQMSQPQIMFKARLRNGEEIIVDDYREAYFWLRDKTPEDSRVMAWWDYGYQITGIGNRTSIADGNTWNHEHIATLGRILSASEKKAHRIARHLADYVLVWAGGGGDDLAKSPHMARIGNSVYHDICPGDPTCSQFGFYQGGRPTPMMAESLLYKLTQWGYRQDIKLDTKNRFKEVFTSKYGKVRIFKVQKVSKESKAWIADPANRVCDAEGSWYCSGQYPPALKSLIDKRKPFMQLEDFNKAGDAQSKKYQEEYHKRLGGKHPLNKEHNGEAAAKLPGGQPKYVGCYGSEGQFSEDKVYGGGGSGAFMFQARSLAQDHGKKYVAIAKVGEDGHSFAFNGAPTGKSLSDSGCNMPCGDYPDFKCGCADAACGDGISAVPGEDNVRRWVVYEVPAKKKKTKKKSKKSAKKKTGKKSNDEL